jgi:putative SOS response-associated peptidase YedK
MTRGYCLDANSQQIASAFDAHPGPDPWRGGTLAPGEFAPIIIASHKTGQRVIRPMVWGYPAPGGISADGRVNWVPTVRNVESPFWIGNLRHTELRCLVPATSFVLRTHGNQSRFALADQNLFVMAGIWRDLTDMPVFAILSTEAAGEAKNVGASSQPVILNSAQQKLWLSADWKQASSLISPFTGAVQLCA